MRVDLRQGLQCLPQLPEECGVGKTLGTCGAPPSTYWARRGKRAGGYFDEVIGILPQLDSRLDVIGGGNSSDVLLSFTGFTISEHSSLSKWEGSPTLSTAPHDVVPNRRRER